MQVFKWFSILALTTALFTNTSLAQEQTEDWREEYSYTLGVQAYIYAYPLIYMTQLRHDWVTNPDASFYAAFNSFHHKKVLSNAQNYTSGGSPNQDTLYSWGWMDLRNGPVILSHPDMGDRYFTFEIADFHSDNFAYVGKRTTGSTAGAFAITPPGWTGVLPDEIKETFASPTPYVLVFGRTLVDGEEDVPEVVALQKDYLMTPLAYWKSNTSQPESRETWAPYDRNIDPLADWRTINRSWSENPVDRDADLVRLFSEIGIGPGFSPDSIDTLPEPVKRGLARAAITAEPMTFDMMTTGGYKSKLVNGWFYPPKSFGRAGLAQDFVTRAAVQSRGGIIANDPEEAVYMNTFTDVDGNALSGDKDYIVKFDAAHLPLVNEFWSLTLNGLDANFVDNPINRYAIGDRSQFLDKSADGSFDLLISSTQPEGDASNNWLPSPAGKDFYLVLRAYGPKQPLIDQTWEPPAVTSN